MVSSDPLLKTQQVAKALGVSGATVKRWVDSGLIRAIRTVGKHRLVPASEVKRVSMELGASLGKSGLPTLPGVGVNEADYERIAETLNSLLRDGRAEEARGIIQSVSRSRRDGSALADRVIRPLMEQIGHRWMVGAIDIYQEHYATSTVIAAIQERIDEVRREQTGPGLLALGATTEGDFSMIPGLLAELVLLEQGWSVRNLGANLPLRSLANAAREFRPRLIYLSLNHQQDEERFIREYLAFYEAAAELDVAVILGGRALRAELRAQLPYTAFGDRMSHLAEFARRLTPQSTMPASKLTDSSSADREAKGSSDHDE